MSAQPVSCFKAYDIRGLVPESLNEDIAYLIGRAFAEVTGARTVAVGHDIRLTSPALAQALTRALTDAGADVHELGLCGTEEVYFATGHFDLDGGIMVTASHNPMDYNGMKLVRAGARPISGDSGLDAIRRLTERGDFSAAAAVRGTGQALDAREAYLECLLSFIDPARLKPLKIAMDAGNGGAGPVVDALASRLPFDIVRVNFTPDGHFPNGIPNPLLPERRDACIRAVRDSGADLGVAWDGDFDRCFFFDENGRFIEGYYLVGLLAEAFLRKQPGARILYDTRLTWNTIDTVTRAGGIAVQSKTGHAFIKEKMRAENALYGGEMSAHHYFRDFFYCDSGMIPWLLVAELMSTSGKSLSALVDDRMRAFPCSGEINFTVDDAARVVESVRERLAPEALKVDETDGLSLEFAHWRFNLRSSNTEPLLRLNVETRADDALLQEKQALLTRLITA